jgi:hypothetical protein
MQIEQVYGSPTKLHDVPNETHNQETGTDSLADLNEFALVGW